MTGKQTGRRRDPIIFKSPLCLCKPSVALFFTGLPSPIFYAAQTAAVQEKIESTFRLIWQVDRVPEKFLKHLTGPDGLYEIRVKVGKPIYRVFCCFNQNNVVVLFNAFQKKTAKTPKG